MIWREGLLVDFYKLWSFCLAFSDHLFYFEKFWQSLKCIRKISFGSMHYELSYKSLVFLFSSAPFLAFNGYLNPEDLFFSPRSLLLGISCCEMWGTIDKVLLCEARWPFKRNFKVFLAELVENALESLSWSLHLTLLIFFAL